MTLLVPGSDLTALRAQLAASPDAWLVACFCAAWCDTCEEYKPKLRTLSGALPQHVFAWIDIEDHAELLGEVDVENFPTLLIQIGGRVVFYGPMPVSYTHLDVYKRQGSTWATGSPTARKCRTRPASIRPST